MARLCVGVDASDAQAQDFASALMWVLLCFQCSHWNLGCYCLNCRPRLRGQALIVLEIRASAHCVAVAAALVKFSKTQITSIFATQNDRRADFSEFHLQLLPVVMLEFCQLLFLLQVVTRWRRKLFCCYTTYICITWLSLFASVSLIALFRFTALDHELYDVRVLAGRSGGSQNFAACAIPVEGVYCSI